MYKRQLHANPDGRKIAEGGNLWRKNRHNDSCGASFGVDLNRNFSFYWGAWGGSSSASCDETYRGSAAEVSGKSINQWAIEVFEKAVKI